MSNLSAIPAATLNGNSVSLNDILYTLKISNRLDLFQHACDDQLLIHAIREAGIDASTAELQGEADTLRQSLGLNLASETLAWLEERSLTVDDFEHYAWRRITARKLKQAITDPMIEDHFANHRPEFDLARLSRIVTENESLAHELLNQISRPGADFNGIAYRYSIDVSSRLAGGCLGYVRRMSLGPEIGKAVFLSNPVAIVGPIQTEAGWELVRVEEIQRASLDADTRTLIADLLFNDWLRRSRNEAGLSMLLGPQIVAAKA